MIEVGVARPMAQGQAMISTATALTSAKVRAGSGPKTSQTRKVRAAAAITAGTNHAVTRSTSAWIGSFEPCACSTMRMIWASTVSAPMRVARKVKLPVLLMVPPTTSAPADLLHRHRLAGDHGFIDEGGAFDDLAVDRDLLAGADLDDVAGEHLIERDLAAPRRRAARGRSWPAGPSGA